MAEEIKKSQSVMSTAPPAKSRLRRLWDKTGLDIPTITTMIKFALPAAISLCIFQSDAISSTFGSVGYLIAVGAIISSGLAPRATFIEATICNVIALSITAAVTTFAMWTILKARENQLGHSTQAYSSSASAVAGIWLFFMIYVINALKFTRAQFKFACVLSSIMVTVAMSYAPQFSTMSAGLDLVRRLYGAIMLGIAICTGVSLFFNPTSCRQIVFKDISTYLTKLRKALDSERMYMAAMETQNPFKSHAEGKALQADIGTLRATHGKLFANLGPAKKEIAWGRLAAADIAELQRLLRRIFLPILGTATIMDIFERLAKMHGWGTAEEDFETEDELDMMHQYQDMLCSLHTPLEELHLVLGEAINHISLRLKLKGVYETVRENLHRVSSRREQKTRDIEKTAGDAGHDDFANYLERAIQKFYVARVGIIRIWCAQHDIHLAPDSFESDFDWITNDGDSFFGTPVQRQLFVLLYIEFLQWSAANAILTLVRFADLKVADGTMTTKRLILPGRKTWSKWMRTFAKSAQSEDSLGGGHDIQGSGDTKRTLWASTFQAQKDPEHLPPTHGYQKIGAFFRSCGSFLRSQHSQFGFRVAVAVMSLQVMSFLRQTQYFFIEQRVFWAAIMISVSMTRTSGQASFIYFLRLCGTLLGALCCYIIYYIVDEKTVGTLVFYTLFIVAFGYIPAKNPRLSLANVIATVTCTLVIGYELQVRKIGESQATANEQKYYPIYLLAPFRLATTAAGIFVAWIFTVFPFSITEGSELRRDLGVSLYTLAMHYSLVQETVAAQISGDHGDLSVRTSPGRKLERSRVKLMSKQMLLLQSMRSQSDFTKWQIPIDAPFPRATYDKIIELVEQILNYTALIGYASTSFATRQEDANEETMEWQKDFGELLESVQKTSDEVTSLLCLLSSSILNSQPLPPHLHLPAPYSLLQKMQVQNKDILDISHVAERGYSAFAVMQIASRSITVDLYKLVE